MLKTDKVAILLATYNGEKYIKEQLDSIIGQSFSDWHLLIHDDGSKDETVKIIKEYEEKFPEKISILEGAPQGGAKKNFFYLMKNVDAPYIMFADQDDVWLKDKVKLSVEKMLEAEKEIGSDKPILVFADLKVVDEKLEVISESMNKFQSLDPKRVKPENLMIQNVVTGCTSLINKKLLELSVKECDLSKVIMHDWWYALIAAEFGKVSYLDEAVILYRQHGDNSVGAKDVNSAEYAINKLKKSDEIKESLKLTRIQAGEFAKTFGLKDSLFDEYSKLSEKGKLERLNFYKKYDVKKTNRSRNIGLTIWG